MEKETWSRDLLSAIRVQINEDFSNNDPKTRRMSEFQAEAIDYISDFVDLLIQHNAIDREKSEKAFHELATYMQSTRSFGNKFHDEAV